MPEIKDKRLYDETLKQLRIRMRRGGEFPSLAKSLQRIQQAMANEAASDSELVEAVLGDVAMTQKTLRLANSAMYASFACEVTTVTQALLVLGTDTVGHLATGLKIIDQLESVATTSAAKSELAKSTAAGLISRQVAAAVSGRDGEEASVATLMHRLGWLLVTFYLPEQSEQVRHAVDTGLPEEIAEAQVLGAPAWMFGHELGREWGLPDVLCNAMNPSPGEPGSHSAWICNVAAFSRAYAQAVGQGRGEAQLGSLAAGYAQAIGCDCSALLGAAAQAVASETAIELVKDAVAQPEKSALPAKPMDASARLADAVRTLSCSGGKLKVNQVVSMASELAHRALGFHRTMFFLRNAPLKRLQARILLGMETRVGEAQLQFEDAFSPNVFHLALANRRPVFISNAMDASIRKRMPAWYLDALPDVRSFLLLPVTVGTQAVGLLYADWGANDKGSSLSGEELAQLDILRSCMVQAFEQLHVATPAKVASSA